MDVKEDFSLLNSPENLNYHQLLGVSVDSTQDEAKNPYFQCARKFHPDRIHIAHAQHKARYEELFNSIATAYDILNNEQKKKEDNPQLSNENYDEIAASIRSGDLLNGKRKSEEINALFEQYCKEYEKQHRMLTNSSNKNNENISLVGSENTDSNQLSSKNCAMKVNQFLNEFLLNNYALVKFLDTENSGITNLNSLIAFDTNEIVEGSKGKLREKYFQFILENATILTQSSSSSSSPLSDNIPKLDDLIKQIEKQLVVRNDDERKNEIENDVKCESETIASVDGIDGNLQKFPTFGEMVMNSGILTVSTRDAIGREWSSILGPKPTKSEKTETSTEDVTEDMTQDGTPEASNEEKTEEEIKSVSILDEDVATEYLQLVNEYDDLKKRLNPRRATYSSRNVVIDSNDLKQSSKINEWINNFVVDDIGSQIDLFIRNENAMRNNNSGKIYKDGEIAKYLLEIDFNKKESETFIDDEESDICMNSECGDKFTMFTRRHHCRMCGKLFCKKCLVLQRYIECGFNKPTKICKSCFKSNRSVLFELNLMINDIGNQLKEPKQSADADTYVVTRYYRDQMIQRSLNIIDTLIANVHLNLTSIANMEQENENKNDNINENANVNINVNDNANDSLQIYVNSEITKLIDACLTPSASENETETINWSIVPRLLEYLQIRNDNPRWIVYLFQTFNNNSIDCFVCGLAFFYQLFGIEKTRQVATWMENGYDNVLLHISLLVILSQKELDPSFSRHNTPNNMYNNNNINVNNSNNTDVPPADVPPPPPRRGGAPVKAWISDCFVRIKRHFYNCQTQKAVEYLLFIKRLITINSASAATNLNLFRDQCVELANGLFTQGDIGGMMLCYHCCEFDYQTLQKNIVNAAKDNSKKCVQLLLVAERLETPPVLKYGTKHDAHANVDHDLILMMYDVCKTYFYSTTKEFMAIVDSGIDHLIEIIVDKLFGNNNSRGGLGDYTSMLVSFLVVKCNYNMDNSDGDMLPIQRCIVDIISQRCNMNSMINMNKGNEKEPKPKPKQKQAGLKKTNKISKMVGTLVALQLLVILPETTPEQIDAAMKLIVSSKQSTLSIVANCLKIVPEAYIKCCQRQCDVVVSGHATHDNQNNADIYWIQTLLAFVDYYTTGNFSQCIIVMQKMEQAQLKMNSKNGNEVNVGRLYCRVLVDLCSKLNAGDAKDLSILVLYHILYQNSHLMSIESVCSLLLLLYSNQNDHDIPKVYLYDLEMKLHTSLKDLLLSDNKSNENKNYDNDDNNSNVNRNKLDYDKEFLLIANEMVMANEPTTVDKNIKKFIENKLTQCYHDMSTIKTFKTIVSVYYELVGDLGLSNVIEAANLVMSQHIGKYLNKEEFEKTIKDNPLHFQAFWYFLMAMQSRFTYKSNKDVDVDISTNNNTSNNKKNDTSTSLDNLETASYYLNKAMEANSDEIPKMIGRIMEIDTFWHDYIYYHGIIKFIQECCNSASNPETQKGDSNQIAIRIPSKTHFDKYFQSLNLNSIDSSIRTVYLFEKYLLKHSNDNKINLHETILLYIDFGEIIETAEMYLESQFIAMLHIMNAMNVEKITNGGSYQNNGKIYGYAKILLHLIDGFYLWLLKGVATPMIRTQCFKLILYLMLQCSKICEPLDYKDDHIKMLYTSDEMWKITIQSILQHGRLCVIPQMPIIVTSIDMLFYQRIGINCSEKYIESRIVRVNETKNKYKTKDGTIMEASKNWGRRLLCNELFAYYYQMEGIWKGWYNETEAVTFEHSKVNAMQSILDTFDKPFNVNSIESLLNWDVIPRNNDGFMAYNQHSRCFTLNLPIPSNNEYYSNINGFTIDFDNGTINFNLEKSTSVQNQLFTVNDISEVFNLQLEFGFFSLDQVMNNDYLFYCNPFQQMKYHPHRLKNTNYMATMFFTDYILKMITQCTEMSSKSPFKQRNAFTNGFMSKMPPPLQKNFNLQHFRGVAFDRQLKQQQQNNNLSQQEKKEENEAGGNDDETDSNMQDSKLERIQGKAHRFWLENETIKFTRSHEKINSDSSKTRVTFTLGDVEMKIKTHLLKLDEKRELINDEKDNSNNNDYENDSNHDGKKKKETDKDESGEAMFAESFSQHYNDFGKYFPIFNRLKMLIKISAIYRMIKSQYSGILEMKSNLTYGSIKTQIDTTLLQMRNDLVKQLHYWPINCTENVDHMLNETLKLNNVSQWEVDESEILRVRSRIEAGLNNQQIEIENQIYQNLCQTGELDGESYSDSARYIKSNINQWITNGKNSYSSFSTFSTYNSTYDTAHTTIVDHIANHLYNKQMRPLENLLTQLQSLGLHQKTQDTIITQEEKSNYYNISINNSDDIVDYVPMIFTKPSKINQNEKIDKNQLQYLVFGGVLLNPNVQECNENINQNVRQRNGPNRFINIATIGRGNASAPGQESELQLSQQPLQEPPQAGFGRILGNQLPLFGINAVGQYYNQTLGNRAMKMANQAAFNQRQVNMAHLNGEHNNHAISSGSSGDWNIVSIEQQAMNFEQEYLGQDNMLNGQTHNHAYQFDLSHSPHNDIETSDRQADSTKDDDSMSPQDIQIIRNCLERGVETIAFANRGMQ